PQHDATRHREERQQKQDERDVFEQHRMAQRRDRRLGVVKGEERDDDQRRPDGGDLAQMMLPEFMGEERKEGDREEYAEERQRPGEGELGAVEVGRLCSVWEEDGEGS